MSKFIARHECVKCKKRIGFNERFDNGGVCPHCGHISGRTICETTTVAVAYDPPPPKTEPPTPTPEPVEPPSDCKINVFFFMGVAVGLAIAWLFHLL